MPMNISVIWGSGGVWLLRGEYLFYCLYPLLREPCLRALATATPELGIVGLVGDEKKAAYFGEGRYGREEFVSER